MPDGFRELLAYRNLPWASLSHLKGEMGYVKHDVSKAIKTVMNSASGGFREQAADLKRVSGLRKLIITYHIKTSFDLLVIPAGGQVWCATNLVRDLATPFPGRERGIITTYCACFYFPGERNPRSGGRDKDEATPFRRARAGTIGAGNCPGMYMILQTAPGYPCVGNKIDSTSNRMSPVCSEKSLRVVHLPFLPDFRGRPILFPLVWSTCLWSTSQKPGNLQYILRRSYGWLHVVSTDDIRTGVRRFTRAFVPEPYLWYAYARWSQSCGFRSAEQPILVLIVVL